MKNVGISCTFPRDWVLLRLRNENSKTRILCPPSASALEGTKPVPAQARCRRQRAVGTDLMVLGRRTGKLSVAQQMLWRPFLSPCGSDSLPLGVQESVLLKIPKPLVLLLRFLRRSGISVEGGGQVAPHFLVGTRAFRLRCL